jgi:YVTN family beta-propeller protein
MAKRLKADCFDIVNKDNKPILFRTDDVLINKLVFSITNLTGEILALKGGEPVRLVKGMQATGESGSTFNFSFELMLTSDVVKNLTLGLPDGWKAAFFDGSESKPPSWSIAPVADMSLSVGEVVKVKIENIKCSTTRPGNFEVLYRNIPGFTNAIVPAIRHLNVINPPTSDKANLPLKHGYINPIHPIQGQDVQEQEISLSVEQAFSDGEAVPVYITYDPVALIQNGFTLILSNTSRDPLVPAAEAFDFYDPDDVNPPVVYLSFLFGEEDYAVTTQQLADNNMGIDINATSPWLPAAHTGGSSFWTFNPQSRQVMQGLETVYFPIKKIITTLDVLNLSVDQISIMYIQVNNIPGYNDAVYTLQLQKRKAIAAMDNLEVSKREIEIGEDLSLTWKSLLARRVTIDYKTRDDETIVLDSAKGDIKLSGREFKLPVPPSAKDTVITATAFGNPPEERTLERTIRVNQKPAEIISFTADPLLLDVDVPADITLSWQVTNAQTLILVTPEGEQNVSRQNGIVIKNLDTAFRFTLKAYSYYQQQPLMTSVVADVFAIRREKPIPRTMLPDKIQPMPAVLINQKYGKAYIVNKSDNLVCEIDAAKLTASYFYPGDVIIQSGNEDKLFIFNPAKEFRFLGVVMYDTETRRASKNYYVPGQAAGPYPGTSMLVTPDLKKFYFSVLFRAGITNFINVQQYKVNAQDNSMTWEIGVGMNDGEIYALSFNHTADKIYIARNSAVEVKSLSDGLYHKRLEYPASKPFMFVCPRATARLYLPCGSRNGIMVIDTATDSIVAFIILKNNPVNLVLSPDERYLYAAVAGSDEIAVIDTQSNEVISAIATGKAPMGMAFDKDGELMFITNYCSKTLSVFALKSNKMLSSTLETGADKGNPLDVGVYQHKDGSLKVFIAKEDYSGRFACDGSTKNTGLDVSVFTFWKPANK